MSSKDEGEEDQSSSWYNNLWERTKQKFVLGKNSCSDLDSNVCDTKPESMEDELDNFYTSLETIIGENHDWSCCAIRGSYSRVPHCFQLEAWDCGE